jgi:hypothetical protein
MPASPDPSSDLRARWLPPAVVAAVFVAMLSFSWGCWPDVLIDFGTELYTAWTLASGKALGPDVFTSATGPLSPYLNAFAFRVLGTGLWRLVLVNLAVLAVITAFLFVLLQEIGDTVSATLSTSFFLLVFAFGQYLNTGNYNYVTPYSHGATHGMLFSLAAVALQRRAARTGALRDVGLSALAFGLVLLTKPEIAVACGAALAAMVALRLREAPPGQPRVRLALAAALPVAVPALVSFVVLAAARGDAGSALRTTLAPWIAMTTPVARTVFYAKIVGLDDPLGNLVRAGRWLGAGIAVFGAAAGADLVGQRLGAPRAVAAVAAAAAAVGAVALVPMTTWADVASPLPVVAAAGAALALVAAWRAPRPCPPARLLEAGLGVFATTLLLKMALNARIQHYGFVLAMPAAVLLVTWLTASVPRALAARGGSGLVFRAVAAALVLVVAAAFLRQAQLAFRRKAVAVGSGPDVFLADARGAYVKEMVAAIAERVAPGATLAVLPEGVMINYLARRETPSPYLTYMPDGMALLGEQALLAPLQAHPPDFVVVVSRDTSELGPAFFGVDYAQATLGWIKEHYDPVGKLGPGPFQRAGYGMLLLRRAR